MAITWADVTLIAPQFAAPAVSVDQQNAILAEVNESLEESQWGSAARCDIGRKYLAAHIAAGVVAASATAPAGATTSMGAGPLARSWAAPVVGDISDGQLNDTWYGRRYIQARQSFVVGRIGITG